MTPTRLTGLPAAAALLAAAVLGLADSALAQNNKKEPQPKPADKAAELELAVRKLKLPTGLKLDLWAAEPQLFNPVAICFDEKGRLYVAETHRWKSSTYDIRGYQKWWDDDLACRTVADRDAMHRKWMGDKAEKLNESEIVRMIEDSNGDGKADRAEVFADGFNTLADGLAAGVLWRDGSLYLTAIPNLWRLHDPDRTGKAVKKELLHTGYGVRLAFLGHDLHGLVFGPDGKLYFSIGDRGANVKTPDGRHLYTPDQGCVFRCNADGSELEIVYTGLRNPQELAFDEFGNLFTCDNNCDNGDKARWVWLVEGGDSGWRIGNQWMGKSSPWIADNQWGLDPNEPAWRLPPLAHVSHGPSGLAYHPGVAALPARYERHFFLCNCPGNVLSLAVKPKGAAFEVTDVHEILGNLWPSDITFGNDGALYVSDWVGAWDKNNKGRIFKLTDPASATSPMLDEVKKLIAEGTAGKSTADLAGMLAHPDMRIRQNAQFALAAKGAESLSVFADAAKSGKTLLARVHGIWGLGQIGAKEPKAVEALLPLLADGDAEIRAQAAKVLGDRRAGAAFDGLVKLLSDGSPRVRLFAAISLGKLGRKDAVAPLIAMIKANADADAFLRHAGVYGLQLIGDVGSLVAAGKDADKSVRLAALLALRRLERPEIAMFLSDAETMLRTEAARAIYDVPVPAAMPALAAMADKGEIPAKVINRVIWANFRVGTASAAANIAGIAARKDIPEKERINALKALAAWPKPPGRDQVVGMWRPLPDRDGKVAGDALRLAMAHFAPDTPAKVKAEAAQAAAKLGVKGATADLLSLVKGTELDPLIRADALATLAGQKDAPLADAVTAALADPSDVLRRQAVRLIPKAGLPDAAALLEKFSSDGPVTVRQAAVAAAGEWTDAAADELLTRRLGELASGKLPVGLQLDLLEAAGKRTAPTVKDLLSKHEASRGKDPTAAYAECLEGGDASAGRRLFYENAALGCYKCHKINGDGGDVGPSLSKIGAEKDRRYLLEAVVLPNKEIAKGYEQVVILANDETTEVGRVEKETDAEVVILRADGSRKTLAKADIQARRKGESAMPADLMKSLSKRDLRDVVEFLSTLREEKGVGHGGK
jgi:quinoprotein glucose dehydrogenase